MAKVRDHDTKPERLVRKLVHFMGYRYRLHRRELPGTPDLVFVARRKVIFIHGCFWHQHQECGKSTCPQSNVDFLNKKLFDNMTRDVRVVSELDKLRYQALVIWECQAENTNWLARKISAFLENNEEVPWR